MNTAGINTEVVESLAPVPTIMDEEKMKQDPAHIENIDALTSDDVVMRSPFDDFGPWKTAKIFKKATAVALFAAFSACADGFQISITNTIIANTGFIKQFGTATTATGAPALAANVLSIWGGIGSMGQGLGMITMHFIADRFGRKIAFYCIWLVLLCCICCESFGRVWQVWLVAKLTSGYAVGSVQFLTGSYVTEIAPARVRGFLLLFYSVWYGLGQLFSTIALKVMSVRNPNDYLTVIYCEWAVLGVMGLVYAFIPESPYWCANHGKHEQGRKIVHFLNGGVKDYDVDFHYGLIRRHVEIEKRVAKELMGEKKPFWKDLWDTREIFMGVNGFRTLIAFMPAAVQQLSGLAVVGFCSRADTRVMGLAVTIIGAFALDYVGRRSCFLFAVAATWCCLITIGGLGLAPKPTSTAVNKFTLFVALMWRAVSTLLGDLGWSYVAETGSSRLRAKTAGFAAAGGVCIGLVFSTSVPYMLSAQDANWGLKTCFFFAGVSAPLMISTWFIMPDTSRRTPAELDEMFEKKVRPWKFRGYVTEAQKALQAERDLLGTEDVAAIQTVAAQHQGTQR
ncbi:hypothetical protein EHS25_001344 [Saitozyma podzolica]|uniref:Major facilitator superfamily (MFS) profile domain-containing protein n=1 Tax=Saitozyma podzolica TaxID=1890683 RepID=A0A427YFR3_9TREE|nr:hypothetical protein EHS25_001344 [Saitozyma podzolica]